MAEILKCLFALLCLATTAMTGYVFQLVGRLFAAYFVKQIFYSNIDLFEINFTMKLLPFIISYHHLWYQTA